MKWIDWAGIAFAGALVVLSLGVACLVVRNERRRRKNGKKDDDGDDGIDYYDLFN